MELSTARLKLFTNRTRQWPHPDSYAATPSTLADAGFFFLPAPSSPDNVVCFLCQKSLDGWTDTDDPYLEHFSHARRCGWAILKTIRVTDDELPFRWDNEDELPKGPRMTKARLQTFGRWWPHEHTKGWYGTTKRMANAGFFYAPEEGSDDRVQCSYCDLALDGWEATDDPVHEHQRRCPACPFFATRAAAPTKASAAKVTKCRRKATGAADHPLSKEQVLLLSPKSQRVHGIKQEEMEFSPSHPGGRPRRAAFPGSSSRPSSIRSGSAHFVAGTSMDLDSTGSVKSVVRGEGRPSSPMRSVGFTLSAYSDQPKAAALDSQPEAEEVEPPRRRSLRLQADDEGESASTPTPATNARPSPLSEASNTSASTSGRKRRQPSSKDVVDATAIPSSRFAYLSKSQIAPNVSVVVAKKRKLAKNKHAVGHQPRENLSDADGEVSGEDTIHSRSQDPTPNNTPDPSTVSASASSSGSRRRLAQGRRSPDEEIQELVLPSNTVKPTAKKRGSRQKKIKEEALDDRQIGAPGSSDKNVGRRQVKRSTRSNTSIAQLKSPLKKQRKTLIEIFPEDDEEQDPVRSQDSSSQHQNWAAVPAEHDQSPNDAMAGVDDSAAGEEGTRPINTASAAQDAQPSDMATVGAEEEVVGTSNIRSATPTSTIPALQNSSTTDQGAGDDASLEPSRILAIGSTTPVRRKAVSLMDSEEAEVVIVDPTTPIRRAAQKADFEGWEDEDGRSSSPRRLTSPFISPSQWPLNGILTVSTPIRKRTPMQPDPGISPRAKVKDVVGNAGLKASTRHAGMDGTFSPSSPSTPLKRKTLRLDMSPEKKHSRLIDRLEGLMHENAASEVMAVAEHALRKEVRDLKRSQNRERRQLAESTATSPADVNGDGPKPTSAMEDHEEGVDQFSHIDVNLRTPVKQTGTRSYESTTPLTTPINKTPLPISKVISAIGAASRRNNNTASSPFVRTPVKKAVSALRLEDLEVDKDAADIRSRDLEDARRNRQEFRTEKSHASTTATTRTPARHADEGDQPRDLTGGPNDSIPAPRELYQKQPPLHQKLEGQKRPRPAAESRTRLHPDPKEDRRRQNLVKQASLSEEELGMTVEEFHRACVAEMVMALEIQAEELVQKFEEESERVRRALLDDGTA
ncbi:unnamed protein product [Mortierella alpina]